MSNEYEHLVGYKRIGICPKCLYHRTVNKTGVISKHTAKSKDKEVCEGSYMAPIRIVAQYMDIH